MGYVDPGDVVRLTAKMLVAGEDIVNVYWFRHDGSTDVLDTIVHEFLAIHVDVAMNNLVAYLTSSLAFTTIETFNVTKDLPMVEAPWPSQTGGANASDRFPSQVAALVTFPTAAARSLGKKYLGVFGEDTNDNFGQPSSVLQGALADYVVDILTAISIVGENFVIGHYRTATGVFIDWVSGIVETVWATQRRRKKGSGS